jgi:hypothetical protein
MCMLDERWIMAFGALGGGMEILCVRFRWDLCEDEMGVLKGSRRGSLYYQYNLF